MSVNPDGVRIFLKPMSGTATRVWYERAESQWAKMRFSELLFRCDLLFTGLFGNNRIEQITKQAM